ncbi:ABC transporter ATP-binding protein [Demetria terragena]|uniref:ABC transporter ATP-binding protein n=1 Tax=Demetria terragena TaxID=63959 RepID=UPI0003716B86|nr:ABC transporter ATP-binding protein [Demetria terragena]
MVSTAFTVLAAEGVSQVVDEVPLVAPTDIEVRPGQAVVLSGPNGSGKSTLLRLMIGATQPSTGTVLLDGDPVDERSPRTRNVMAALLNPITGYRHHTVQDHLVLVDQTWGGSRETCARRVQRTLDQLDIDPLRHRYLHELSSGQRQLVDLALTLIRPSGLLVLDEPEQRLDRDRRALLTRILAETKGAGTALLLACHDHDMIASLADDQVRLEIPEL